jgi:hypothetical protein
MYLESSSIAKEPILGALKHIILIPIVFTPILTGVAIYGSHFFKGQLLESHVVL